MNKNLPPKVSIIIATFNSEKSIHEALDSVFNQAFQNWECIIIDGASKDNTIRIVKEFTQKDYRFHYISEPDKGIYDAFNKGWRIAKGEWIYYLGSDDLLLPDGLENLIKGTNTSLFDIIYGNVICQKETGEIMKSKTNGHQALPYKMLACHQAIITKKKLIEELNGFDLCLKAYADKDFYIRAVINHQYTKFLHRDIKVAIFTLGGTSEISIDKFKEEFRIFKKNHLPFSYLLFQITRILWLYIKKWLHLNINI